MSQRSARESSDHLGNHSSGIYRLSRFSASSEAGKAKQLQAGLRVHIRTTRLRELQCSRSLAGEGECIFMCCCQDQEVEEWRLGASSEGLGASMVAVVRSEACL